MARNDRSMENSFSLLGRIILGCVVVVLILTFFVWRIDSPRMERFRMAVYDAVLPKFSWASAPIDGVRNAVATFQSYTRIYEQNQQLRRELQQMRAWKEAASQLEQENARLLDLNRVKLDPQLTHLTGVVIADSGGPFRQTVLLNLGREDGVLDGWAVMDGLGLVGRISGLGNQTSRVILIFDDASRIPITIEPSGQKGILIGNNTNTPTIEFIESVDNIRPGDRVVTSGDGGVFPSGLLIGQVIVEPSTRLKLLPVADFQNLEYLRVVRYRPREVIDTVGAPIGETAIGDQDAP
ncbi:MAG: rod shape-determining protein MreC [Planktomarina sp.]